MPRILRILNRFNLGGPTFNAGYLTRYLSPEFETMLVGGQNDPTEKNSAYIVNRLGVEPVIIPEMRREISPVNDRKAYLQIKQLIREFRPHIVHTHASKAGAIGRMAAFAMKAPVVLHTFQGHVFDAYFSRHKTLFYKTIERYLARKSTGIIAISDTQKTDLAEKYRICSPEKIRVIPLGFDLNPFKESMEEKRKAFRQTYGIKNVEIAIGIIGRLVPVKNHLLFLKALKLLKEQRTLPLRAFIVGDGELRQKLEEKARALGLEEPMLNFTGWLTDMDRVNAGMDIIALTSLNEGTPVSLIEAQAAGKPIVTTHVGGVEDVVVPGKTALLSESNNAPAFAENLYQLAANRQVRQEMAANGWEHVREKYHYQRLVKDMGEYYYQLLEKGF